MGSCMGHIKLTMRVHMEIDYGECEYGESEHNREYEYGESEHNRECEYH